MKFPFWARLTALFSIVIALGVISSAWMNLRKQRAMIEHEYFRQSELIAATLTPLFLEPLIRGRVADPDQYRRSLDHILRTNEEIVDIRVFRDDGEPLLPDLPGKDSESRHMNLLTLQRAISLQIDTGSTRPIGWIELSIDTRRLDEALSMQIRESLRAAFIFLLLGLLTSLGISRLVTGPLGRLAAGMARLREGDLGISVRVESTDEIGDLARAFNETVEGLRAKQELLPYVPETLWRIAHSRAKSGSAAETVTAKPLTILFCDLRGFTTYSDLRMPEEVVMFLNRFFEAAASAVRDEGGTVDKFIGDACLAIFDLPDGEGAPAAVRAAIRIVRFMRDDELARAGNVGVRVGINTGSAILGDVGAGGRRDFTVIGTEVNKAQRLEAACEPGSIYISDSTRQRLAATPQDVVIEEVPPLRAKGIAEELKAFCVRVNTRP